MPKIKKTRILLIGFGSIGKRHYRNLKSLGYKNIAVYDPDNSQFVNKNVVRLPRLTEKILTEFDIAFICNPNSEHIKTAIQCAKAGCYLFIEKPLSHNLAGIRKLQEICRKKRLVNMVACNMRFNFCLKFIKDYLDKGKLGKIYSFNFQTGFYLPFWRPYQDYRKGYAARKETGGGIIVDGGIHNFDLLFWLNNFARVKKSKIVYAKVSNLKIETEDCFAASIFFENKVLGSITGDYLQKAYSWTCKVVGEKGNLEWSITENKVKLKNEKSDKILFKVKSPDLNQMYIDEIKYFLDCVQKRKKTFNDIDIAKKVLKHCLMR